jgi:nucleoside-diphosphate-sugar epimerase
MTVTAKHFSEYVPLEISRGRGAWLRWLTRLFNSRLQHILDLCTLAAALAFAYMLRFDFQLPPAIYVQLFIQMPYVILVQFVALIVCGVYTLSWQHIGKAELPRFVKATTISVLPVLALRLTLPDDLAASRVPLSVMVVDSILMLSGLVTGRILQRDLHEWLKRREEGRKVRRILVIGGAGYIGSALLPKLLKEGYYVRVLDLLLYGTEAIERELDHPRLEVVPADFRHVDDVVDAMRDMDAVIHLGAIVGDPACALDEHLTIEVNLMATRMIAEVAKGSGIRRFIFASTCSVYGASDQILAENSPLNPVSLYARSKIASERVLLKMGNLGFAPTLLRFATIYGLSGRTRFDLVVNLLTAKALVERQITVTGGDQWRPFVHVDDAASAVMAVLEAPLSAVGGQTFNVGCDDQNYTIQQVSEIIHGQVPSARVIETGCSPDPRNYRVSFAKIRAVLNFVPSWTLEAGVRQVLAAIQDGRVKDYRDARHSNVRFLTEEPSARLCRQDGWVEDLLNETAPAVVAADRKAVAAVQGLVH